MTAVTLPSPGLLTVADFLVLDEDERYRYELQEGVVMVTNKPVPRHQRVLARLIVALTPLLGADLILLPETPIDLGLVPPSAPGFVRVPDLVVVTRAGYERVDAEGGVLRGPEVVLAIEILSPSTRRVDIRIKHDEYADAGIGHYWMIDLDAEDGPALTACHLGGPFGYVDAEPVTGTFTTEEPFPARIDLSALLA
jgi:Uma2 family endonuclease